MDDFERLDSVVCAAMNGDAAAFSELLVHVQPELLRRIRSLVPLDEQNRGVHPEDVLQEVLSAAVRDVGQLRIQTYRGFRKWLLTICRHCAANAMTSRRRLKRGGDWVRIDTDAVDGPFTSLVSFLGRNTKSPRSQAADRELAAMLLQLVSELSTEERTAVELRYLQQRPLSEVARRLGKTEEATKMFCWRVLRFLRGLMPIDSSS